MDGAQPAGVPGARGQRHVDRGAGRARTAAVTRVPGPGEERPAGLVDGDRRHPRFVPEDRLGAVPVVDVGVDVDHPLHAAVQQGPDRPGAVVVDAEARGGVGRGVVQAAREVDAVAHVAGRDGPREVHRPGEHPGRTVVHAGKGRGVRGADAVAHLLTWIDRGPTDRVHQARRVHGAQELVRGHGGVDDVHVLEQPEVPAQPRGQVDPQRRHRMPVAEVVAGEVVVPHDPGPAAHRSTLAARCGPATSREPGRG